MLGQGGRSERYENTGRFGYDRIIGGGYDPVIPKTIVSTPGHSQMMRVGPIECKQLGQFPPTPKSEFDGGGENLIPFYYPTPSTITSTPSAAKDVGSSIDGNHMDLYTVNEDCEVFDGLPTPDECAAALGEVTGVCDDDSPIFVDDDDAGEEAGFTHAPKAADHGPEHCPRMWDDWQYFEEHD